MGIVWKILIGLFGAGLYLAIGVLVAVLWDRVTKRLLCFGFENSEDATVCVMLWPMFIVVALVIAAIVLCVLPFYGLFLLLVPVVERTVYRGR